MTQWASGRFNVNNHAHVIASGATCLARWCYFVFLHRDICADLITQGVSRLKLRRETLSNLLIACPPLDEQLRIIAELEKVVDQTSYALRCIEDVIDLLQERRTALISAAVTGQIDVREFVASSAVSSEASCV